MKTRNKVSGRAPVGETEQSTAKILWGAFVGVMLAMVLINITGCGGMAGARGGTFFTPHAEEVAPDYSASVIRFRYRPLDGVLRIQEIRYSLPGSNRIERLRVDDPTADNVIGKHTTGVSDPFGNKIRLGIEYTVIYTISDSDDGTEYPESAIIHEDGTVKINRG